MYSNTSGETWTMRMSQDGDQVIECPNGETVTLDSSQSAAIQACGGSGASTAEECTIEGGSGMPTACTSQDDCPDGEVCCINYGYCFPDYPGICDG